MDINHGYYSIIVVNDTAERHVKLMDEFNNKITNDEEQKQFLSQVNTYYSIIIIYKVV